MITLLFDGLIAVLKTTDRVCAAVEDVLRRPATPPAVDDAAPPSEAGAASAAAGLGGHPVRDTSQMLYEAESQLGWLCQGNPPAVIRTLRDELRLRAAEFAAIGD